MKSLIIVIKAVFLYVAHTTFIFPLTVHAENWKGWNIHGPGYPQTIAMEEFARLVKEKTNGEISLTIHHSGVLGNQSDAVELVRMGGLEIANFNLAPIGNFVPEANVLSLPFLFKDVAHSHRVLDGEVGDVIAQGMAKRGFTVLAWFDAGIRSFYSAKRPIYKPVDLAGMTVRIINNQIYADMIVSLGGYPTPTRYSDVYKALESGAVDAAENGWPQYESNQHYKVAKYYSLSEHVITPECICIQTALFEGLPSQTQQILRSAAHQASTLQRKLWKEQESLSLERAVAAGAIVNQVSDKAAFQRLMQPVYAHFVDNNPEMAHLVSEILASE